VRTGRVNSGSIPRVSREAALSTSGLVAQEVPAELVSRSAVSGSGRLGVDVEEGGGAPVPHPNLRRLDVDAQGDHGCRIGMTQCVKGEPFEPDGHERGMRVSCPGWKPLYREDLERLRAENRDLREQLARKLLNFNSERDTLGRAVRGGWPGTAPTNSQPTSQADLSERHDCGHRGLPLAGWCRCLVPRPVGYSQGMATGGLSLNSTTMAQ
jgi:hypothetical protein